MPSLVQISVMQAMSLLIVDFVKPPSLTMRPIVHTQRMAARNDLRWFINEWLDAADMKQKDLADITGWSKAKVSALCNGRNGYTRETVEGAARALGCHPFELLIHPKRADLLRQKAEAEGSQRS